MTRKNESEILGQFPSDKFFNPDDPRLEVDPMGVKEMRGDGNIALHDTTSDEGITFGQNDVDPHPVVDLLGVGEGHKITSAQRALGDVSLALSKESRDKDAEDEALANEWARRNGFKL